MSDFNGALDLHFQRQADDYYDEPEENETPEVEEPEEEE